MPLSKRIAWPLTLTWQVSLFDGDDLVDLERRQRERHEGGDAVADLEVAVLELGADLGDRAQQHAAGAGVGVVVLAALLDDAEAVAGHLLDVAALGLFDLREAGRVDVQRVDVDEDLVVVDLHRVVDLPRRLRQDALGLEDPVGAVLVAFFHGRSPSPGAVVRRRRRPPATGPAGAGRPFVSSGLSLRP